MRTRTWQWMLSSLLVLTGLLLIAIPTQAQSGAVIYVDADATGANDGTS
ncbi:MAG: hypothetical protein ACP5HM_14095 [Anaerolineae bacterium]